jgi:hypothetical protein
MSISDTWLDLRDIWLDFCGLRQEICHYCNAPVARNPRYEILLESYNKHVGVCRKCFVFKQAELVLAEEARNKPIPVELPKEVEPSPIVFLDRKLKIKED